MIIKRIDGTATVNLTSGDCALLAEACRAAREADTFGGQDAITKLALCEALEAAFAALGAACSASLSMTSVHQEQWHSHLAQLGLSHLVATE